MIIPIASAAVEVPPPPDGYVLDLAEILSAETEAALESQLTALEATNSSQIVVVTIETLEGYPIESYALDLGREWGIGQDDFNNGAIFLIAETEREVRIEVGYGLEAVITDAQAFSIIDQVSIPYFKEGNFDQGTLESVSYLDSLARGESFDLSQTSSSNWSFSDQELILLVMIFFLLVRGVFVALSQSKAWFWGGIFGGVLGFLLFYSLTMALIFAAGGLLMDFIASTFFYKKFKHFLPRGGHGGWFGGRGGSSGSSGGFGGFGGGGFGGGGASGRF